MLLSAIKVILLELFGPKRSSHIRQTLEIATYLLLKGPAFCQISSSYTEDDLNLLCVLSNGRWCFLIKICSLQGQKYLLFKTKDLFTFSG